MSRAKLFYCTFYKGHPYSNRFVMVTAMNRIDAVSMMCRAHGENWDEIYTEEQFKKGERFKNLQWLATIKEQQ